MTPKDRPASDGDIGLPPDGMTLAARGKWLTACVDWQHFLAESDRDALQIYCEAWAEMINAQARVEEDGAMILTPNGMVQKSPWLTKVEQSREFCRKMLAEFIGSPAARARMDVEFGNVVAPAKSPADDYLN